ncbi:MAG: glycosyl hydrolase [Verrucomicrobiota bacterium]
MKRLSTIVLVLVTLLTSGIRAQSLDEAFAAPPESTQAWVYWWWLNGRASQEGITKDFEEFKEKGISGALLFDAQTGGPDVPEGPVFMSPEWRELFKHSVKEADRLGITLTANMTRGWNAGGPWVTPEHGIKQIVFSASQVTEPGQTDRVLPRPASKNRPYWDVAVLACRLDDGADSETEVWPLDQILDLTKLMDEDGRLVWDAPAGNWSILRIGFIANGKRVAKNKGPSGGLEIDPMSAEAMDLQFANTGAKMIEDAGELAGKSFQYLHIDSWEIKQPDWTPKMPEEFLKRRGYDLTKWLPALCDRQVGSVEETETFLQDFRVTVCDLIAEYYYGRLDRLAKQHGLLGSHSEAGGPIGGAHTFWLDALKFHGVTAMPMGEFWIGRFEKGDATYSRNHTIKQIASAAHIYGKEVCQAEAYTTTADLFTSDLYKIKAVGDLAFCDGLTRMVFHQWIHQPDPEMIPGLWSRARGGKVDIGTKFGHTQTWWPMAKGFLDYLARCQYLLRQGTFVADFAYLLDERIPSYVLARDQQKPLCPTGYDYDALNAEVLLKLSSAVDGQLQLASGMRYRYLVLPPGPNAILSPSTREKIKALAAAGVQVIGPGYREGTLEEITRADGLLPDIEFLEPSPGARFEQIHRRDGETEIYFISNQSLEEVSANVAFRVSGKQPELWNPVTGSTRDLPEWSEENGCTVVPMRFAAKESSFVVFSVKAQPSEVNGAKNFPEHKPVQTLKGPWQVSFDPKWGGPESINFDELIDWTERPEEGIRHYSGRATYRQTFDLPNKLPADQVITLDLGEVHCIVRVTLNGKDLGVVWTAPWQVDISDAVKPGNNQLEIEVTNHWINRIIGDEALPPEKRFTQTNVVSKGLSLQPSGLRGPVSLLISESQTSNE